MARLDPAPDGGPSSRGLARFDTAPDDGPSSRGLARFDTAPDDGPSQRGLAHLDIAPDGCSVRGLGGCVIAAAALCPAAPLMAAELTGDDPDAAAVRAAARGAVAWLVASGVAVVTVVAADSWTREWPVTGRADLAPYGGPRLADDIPRVPLGVGIGARLLDSVGFTGDRLMWTVAPDDDLPPTTSTGRVGLLVLADGSAHRNLKTSTDLASRAETFDAAVERSIMDGDLSTLPELDADGLMVTGFSALRVLAAAMPRAGSTSLDYCAAPFGVGYFVATFSP